MTLEDGNNIKGNCLEISSKKKTELELEIQRQYSSYYSLN